MPKFSSDKIRPRPQATSETHGHFVAVCVYQNLAAGVYSLRYYFILSSEIMENISVIKLVSTHSEMIWYHFTVY